MGGKDREREPQERRQRFLEWLQRRNAAHAPPPIDPSTLGPASATMLRSLAQGMSMDDAYRKAMGEIEADAQAIIEGKASDSRR